MLTSYLSLITDFSMIQFIQPNLLGSYERFEEEYANEIKKGQSRDAEDAEKEAMKLKAVKLHNVIDKYIHRIDYEILKPLIPKKI